MSNVKVTATFKKVAFRMVKEGKEYDVEFIPTKQGAELLTETIQVLTEAKANGVYVPLIGTTDKGEEKYLGATGMLFEQYCKANMITILNNNKKEGSTMNQTVNTNNQETKMTAEEWTAKLMENAAQFVQANGTQTAKDYVANATESEAAENLAYAVASAGNTSGKKEEAEGILATLNPLVSQAKAQGTRFINWLGRIAKLAWRKVSAAVVGTGIFAFHTVGILFNHTVAAGKEIGECFKTDVVDRVKNA